jgi:hypothetical protein
MVYEFDVKVNVGVGFTVTVAVATLLQVAVVPVTVYTVVVPGFTLTVFVLALPALALQVKVAAPPAVKTTLCPEQITVLVATTVGVGDTSTNAVVVAVHTPLAPINVYVVVPLGGVILIVLVF